MVFTSAVNLRYEYAIALPEEDNDGVVVAVLATITAFLISFLMFLVFVLFKNPILHLIGGEELGRWIYLVPLSVFLGGIYNSLNYFSLRDKKYKTIATSNIVKSSLNSGTQLSLGGLGFTKFGLILGNALSLLFGNYKMMKHFWSYRQYLKDITIYSLKIQAKRYKKFPLISVWGILLNNLAINLNNFFISRFFGLDLLGQYSYSYRYLNLPLSVISNNMGQIFFQVCAEKYRKGESAEFEFKSTLKKMMIICFPIFIILYFLVEDIFLLLFGPQWKTAGEIAKMLLPLFFIRTLFSPLSNINLAFEKQKLALIMQLSLFLVSLLVLYLCFLNDWDIVLFITIYVYSLSLIYLILLFQLYLVSKYRL